jgi:hypothetical protein
MSYSNRQCSGIILYNGRLQYEETHTYTSHSAAVIELSETECITLCDVNRKETAYDDRYMQEADGDH